METKVRLITPADGCCFLYSLVAADDPLQWASHERDPLGLNLNRDLARAENIKKTEKADLLRGIVEDDACIAEFRQGRLFEFSELHQFSQHVEKRIRVTLAENVSSYARYGEWPEDFVFGKKSWPL